MLANLRQLRNRGLERPHFLMCPPHHFQVAYSINPWMDPRAWASGRRHLMRAAERQWQALYETMLMGGAEVEVINAIPDEPDLVFTANAAVVLDRKALLARFRYQERRAEEPIFAASMHRLRSQGDMDVVIDLPEGIVLEGAGDCIWDRERGHFWLGFGPRSDSAARHLVTDVFGIECVPLELTDPRFYHLDTAFCALPSGEVMFYPNAFTPAARRAINDRVMCAQQILLQDEDATAFAANAVAVGHRIMLSSCSTQLRDQLEERGYVVTEIPLHTFMLGLLSHSSAQPHPPSSRFGLALVTDVVGRSAASHPGQLGPWLRVC
jgi:N-dimethylarginine dimethylaminohydrolase